MSLETEIKWDTIIIGAGAAGLNAARILSQNNLKVLVLEARNRVGGRIWTLHRDVQGEPVELGAEFVHGVPEEVSRLMDSKFDLYEREGEYLVARHGKLVVEESYFKKIQTVLKYLSTAIEEDCSFADLVSQKCLNETSESIELTKNYVEGYHAADSTQISARALAIVEKESSEANAVEGALYFRGGQQVLIDRLVASMRATLLLEQIVNRVDWSSNEVLVHTNSPKVQNQPLIFKARSILVTVPLGVLKSSPIELGAIQFQPELPRWKQEAISKINMGSAVRITYQFKEPFWEKLASAPKIAMIFDPSREASLGVWWPRGNFLTGWVGGPRTQIWTDLSAKSRRSYGVLAISRMFGLTEDYVDSLLETSYGHDWSEDPFSKGVYSYVRVNGFSAPNRLAEPVENKVFFAGEATQGGGYAGTVNGALLSGQKAAQKILHI